LSVDIEFGWEVDAFNDFPPNLRKLGVDLFVNTRAKCATPINPRLSLLKEIFYPKTRVRLLLK
jgi:hypothetical protein